MVKIRAIMNKSRLGIWNQILHVYDKEFERMYFDGYYVCDNKEWLEDIEVEEGLYVVDLVSKEDYSMKDIHMLYALGEELVKFKIEVISKFRDYS